MDTRPAGASRIARWMPLVVALLAIAAYVPALRAGWIWDDDSYVTENALVQAPDGLLGIWTLGRDAEGRLVSNTPQYYPIVFTTFWIEHALFGLAPAAFHATNLALHLVVAWLAWRVLARIGVPGAGVAAALFALHPMHVETVAWVTERKNLLSGAFYLLAFLAWVRFDDERRPRWWWLAFLAFVAALLSKSVTATLPIVLATAAFFRHGRLGAREIVPLVPFLALGVASGWFTAWLEQVKVGATGPVFLTSAAERWLFVAPRAWWHYAATTWFPNGITFVYPRWDPSDPDPVRFLAPAGIVLLVAALFLAKRRLGWAPILLVFASAVTLAPALGFVPVYPHRYSWVADHFAYLGSLPLLALLVAAAARVGARLSDARRAAAAHATAAVALVACAWIVHRESAAYHDARTLWEATLRDNPRASLAQVSLGIELMRDPARTPADVERARALFTAAADDPNLADQAHSNLAQWHLVRGELDAAARHFRASLRADPGHRRSRAGLAEVLLRDALARGATAAGLAVAREAQRELGPDARFAQVEAWNLAVSADPSVRDSSRALFLARELVAGAPRDAGRLDTLAAAQAAAGDFGAAVRTAEAALALAPPALRAALEARLSLYRRGERYVEPAPPAR